MASTTPSDGFSDHRGTPPMPPPPPSEKTVHKIPAILPPERVFPIQIGGQLFKLSGASLSSDAPSYFSQYFVYQMRRAEENGEDVGGGAVPMRTLYIDRDPETFRDIALHLQGYHVTPRDGTHFVRLFADAQFYSLPKLISQLYEESVFVSIGHREFQISRDLLTDPRNSPNYFSLGFAFFFSRPDNLFPGLEREGLLRPPSILPPSVPNRNADTFAELLRLLRGYEVCIRDEPHRQELLRDARYFHFKGLEQQLLPHHLSYNSLRGHSEITIRLENVQKSGISVFYEQQQPQQQQKLPQHGGGGDGSGGDGSGGDDDQQSTNPHAPHLPVLARISYARPYVDDSPSDLILEIGNQSSQMHFGPHAASPPRLEFFRDTKARVAKLLEVLATKLNLPSTTQPLGLLMVSGGAASQPASPGNTLLSEDLVRVVLGPEASITLDGREYDPASASHRPDPDIPVAPPHNPHKRRRPDGGCAPSDEHPWIITTGQWRLRILVKRGGKSPVECVFEAVKIDAVSSERGRNRTRSFLG